MVFTASLRARTHSGTNGTCRGRAHGPGASLTGRQDTVAGMEILIRMTTAPNWIVDVDEKRPGSGVRNAWHLIQNSSSVVEAYVEQSGGGHDGVSHQVIINTNQVVSVS